MVAQRWFGQAAAIGEEIVGLETFVAKELETRAVDGVRARLDDDTDDAACRPSIFRPVVRRLHLKLLNRVDGRPYRLSGAACSGEEVVVVVETVDEEIVLQRAIPVDVDAVAPEARAWIRYGAWTEENELRVTASVQREIHDCGLFNDLTCR